MRSFAVYWNFIAFFCFDWYDWLIGIGLTSMIVACETPVTAC